jgi:hypothetical protein
LHPARQGAGIGRHADIDLIDPVMLMLSHPGVWLLRDGGENLVGDAPPLRRIPDLVELDVDGTGQLDYPRPHIPRSICHWQVR